MERPPLPSAWEVKAYGEKVEQAITDQAKAQGAAAYNFDPDASPEEKAAQAKKSAPPGLKLQRKTDGKEIGTDMDTAKSEFSDIPMSAKSTVSASRPKSASTVETTPPQTGVNGFPKAGDGEWGRTGWEPRFGSGVSDTASMREKLLEEEDEQDKSTWLETRLDDKYYGAWYHNAGVIVFACLASWLVTWFGGGLSMICIVGAICATYYNTSIARVHRNIRDDINREMALQKLDTDTESLEWMNYFVLKFWPIYQPVLAATVINSVDQVLSTATPAFLDSIRLSTFTLGTKPPRLEHVRTYPKTEDDIIQMDWKFSFTPNDTTDMTAMQLRNKSNPKVVLEVRVGKGIASKGLPIIVEDFSFSGEMRVKIKLQINFPHIEKVDVCFLQPPVFDYVCKPVGGDLFGLDIGFLPGLTSFIRDQVHANLGPMFYAPNVFTVNVAQMLGGASLDTAVGVLQITIYNAHGLKNPDKFSGTPDPYCTFSFNHRAELARTRTKHESSNPVWNETKYLIITSLNDALTMELFDFNEFRKDKQLGIATFDLKNLEEDHEQEGLQLQVMANGKQRGQITCDVKFFPVIQPQKNADGTPGAVPELNTGILKYTVHQAKDLDHSLSMIGQFNPYAVQIINGREHFKTKKLKRTNLPVWEESKNILITNRKACRLGLVIKDDRDMLQDPILGTVQLKLDDMLNMMAKGEEWFNLSGVKSGRVKISAQWQPVEIKGALGGSGGYVTPIGVLRIHCIRGVDLRNVETMGKSDPYCRVMLSGVERAKTVTFGGDLNPEWDEILYIPIHGTREKISLEVMDEEKLGKDRPLGQVDFDVSEYVKEGEMEGEYLEHSVKKEITSPLQMGPGRASKGNLVYTVSFYPSMVLAEEDEEKKEEVKDENKPENAEVVNGLTPLQSKRSSIASKTSGTAVEGEEAAMLAQAEKEIEGEARKKIEPVKLSREEVCSYGSGMLVFKLIEAHLAHKDCFLEVLMDDMLFPSFISSKAKTKIHRFDEIGDAFVRELEFSRINLRLNEKHRTDGNVDKDDIIATLSGNTLTTLQNAYNKPTTLTLKGKDGEISTVTVSLKYIPVHMKLEPRESIMNMGTLSVNVLDGSDLPAADRNGKSDPYVIFELNGEKVFKTQTQKKTLNPTWNEQFEVKIPSRVAAKFQARVFDWDLANDDDFLGASSIDLSDLEEFKAKEVKLRLDGKSGTIRLRLMFKSDYVVRSKHTTGTFHGTLGSVGSTVGKITTGVAGAPIKGVGKVGGGVVKAGSFLTKGFRKPKDSTEAIDTYSGSDENIAPPPAPNKPPPPPPIPVEAPGHHATPSITTPTEFEQSRPKTPSNRDSTGSGLSPFGSHRSNKSLSGASINLAEQGVANITLVGATGYPSGLNVQVHIKTTGKREKEVHKSKAIKSGGEIRWEESFMVNCTADQQFVVTVKDHSFLGADDKIGENLLVVDDSGNVGEVSVTCGPGKLLFRTQFRHSDSGGNGGGNGGGNSGHSKTGSGSKRSLFNAKKALMGGS